MSTSSSTSSSADQPEVDGGVPPSGTGCADCTASGGWWFHLRRCAACGRVGCCDSSPSQHASGHFRATGHPVMVSFEPGEHWAWDFRDESAVVPVPELAPPSSHPVSQPVPGPAGGVPDDWQEHLNT